MPTQPLQDRTIAMTSQGDSRSGQDIQRVRVSVQQRTPSGRRRCRHLLQRLSGKEQRYQTWLLASVGRSPYHNISKTIVQSALEQNTVIAIQDLTGKGKGLSALTKLVAGKGMRMKTVPRSLSYGAPASK